MIFKYVLNGELVSGNTLQPPLKYFDNYFHAGTASRYFYTV